MTYQDVRDKLADRIARRAISGEMLPLTDHAYALELGMDVSAIEARPHAHIIPTEELPHG